MPPSRAHPLPPLPSPTNVTTTHRYLQAAEIFEVRKTTLSRLLAEWVPTGDIHLLKVDVSAWVPLSGSHR
jgi:hypothetical protein